MLSITFFSLWSEMKSRLLMCIIDTLLEQVRSYWNFIRYLHNRAGI